MVLAQLLPDEYTLGALHECSSKRKVPGHLIQCIGAFIAVSRLKHHFTGSTVTSPSKDSKTLLFSDKSVTIFGNRTLIRSSGVRLVPTMSWSPPVSSLTRTRLLCI
ncbi:uncharacterized protein [Miscanthus floridulus]|uniref:uncharacterized protein isoform X1 n=1 Tax=Miscanthus floridulus TaxID=154761 RepID=UPI003458D70E